MRLQPISIISFRKDTELDIYLYYTFVIALSSLVMFHIVSPPANRSIPLHLWTMQAFLAGHIQKQFGLPGSQWRRPGCRKRHPRQNEATDVRFSGRQSHGAWKTRCIKYGN